MKADRIWLLSDLIGERKAVFRIPVYQRNYNWTKENCNRLLDDIKTIIDTGEKHFLGSIVFVAPKDGGFSLKEYTIIDGQQRLTTMILLLKALSDIAGQQRPDYVEQINKSYLYNEYLDEKFKVKLKPINSDNEQFLCLLNNQFESMDTEGSIYTNYKRCKERIESWMKKGITIDRILDALERLEIVEIVLTEGEDDPQIIFESINSTGLELFTSDLIRNFLLMKADNQKNLYESYWLPVEHNLRFGKDYTQLDSFFKHYIVCQTGAKITSRSLYRAFVTFFKENKYTNERILQELKYYSDIFRAFITDNCKYSEDIKKPLRTLRLLKQTTSYPFLLHIFNDYEQQVITKETLLNVLNFLVSYLLRRMVCGVPSNSLSGLFTSLYGQVFKVEKNKQKYYESINKYLSTTLSTKNRLPSVEAFEENLKNSNLYANLALCKFILMDIENGSTKEILSTDNLTIEHLMPQKLSEDWLHVSQEEHERFLHTLGNLTITGYNSELSNKSFTEKKQIIENYSKANVLNKDVTDKDKWGGNTIQARAERLSKIITERYAITPIKDNDIEFEYTETISLANYRNVTGKELSSFTFRDQLYIQDRFINMLTKVVSLLEQEKPGVLTTLAVNKFNFRNSSKAKPSVTTNKEELQTPQEVLEGVFIETNLSSKNILRFLKALFTQYHIDETLFSVHVIAEGEEEEETVTSIDEDE